MFRESRCRSFAAVIAVLAWSALLLQYVLLIRMASHDIGVALATLRYFSYFTILGNLLVALTTTAAWVGASSRVARWLAGARLRGGTALCIGVTAAIYFFVLASTWAPQGLQWLVDVGLHYVVPLLYLAWWIACVPHRQLLWSDALRWLVFPLAYLAWAMLRGAWLHEYPYPFIDVGALGPMTVTRNAFGVGVLFLLLGLLLVGFDRHARRSVA